LTFSRPALAVALTLAFTASADACHRCRSARGVRFLRDVQATTTTTVTVIPPVYAAPQAPPKVMPAPQAVPVQPVYLETPKPVAMGDDAATFLVLVNDARARIGRPALAWDATLAAFAATNAAVHMPGSSGGAGQCWAGVRSYTQAFHMWRGSSAHWAILMGATTSIGVSPCATGMTANCR
jgi:uncharacterized protein YkwD